MVQLNSAKLEISRGGEKSVDQDFKTTSRKKNITSNQNLLDDENQYNQIYGIKRSLYVPKSNSIWSGTLHNYIERNRIRKIEQVIYDNTRIQNIIDYVDLSKE
ncbi:hypothetical protein Glove_428g24 [Diversispora epigaea]|uniref:Uncharacterized protein n=1 Tax=Diversispora epigaea TaxID=1348612 RepID=A0A397GY40_9GLOM|nr:hypothetical protein Glove_428g24 [Diversispora epigaea]